MIIRSEAGRHLGGFNDEANPKTYDKNALAWIWRTVTPARLLDLGCGTGQQTVGFAGRGVDVVSVDGAPEAGRLYRGGGRFVLHDFTAGRLPLAGPFDLALSVEFVEHVEAEHVANIVAAFALARWAIFTHALPDQPGYHHVNCKPAAYWIDLLTAAGFDFRPELSANLRHAAGFDSYWPQSALIFQRP